MPPLPAVRFRVVASTSIRFKSGSPSVPLVPIQIVLQAVQVQNHLTEVFGYAEDNLRFLYSSFREVNIAAPAGPSPELARACSMMAIVLGTVPLHGICTRLVAQSMEIGAHIGQIARAWARNRCAVYYFYVARWKEARECRNL